MPTHISVNGGDCGLSKDSIVLLEQMRTIDKRRLKEKIGALTPTTMQKVNVALMISLGFNDSAEVRSS